jgi:hypothetical protein
LGVKYIYSWVIYYNLKVSVIHYYIIMTRHAKKKKE